MADYNEDPYAFIIDYCIYSTSQEDFLRCTNLVREDDDVTFCTVGYDSTLQSDLIGVKSADDVDLGKRGFREERAGSLSPKLKGDSPLVHCSGKFMIESEVDGDSMVKVVKPIRCVTEDGVECSSDELWFGYGGGGGGGITAEDGVRKYETEDDIGENEVEGKKGNVNFEKSEENVEQNEENVDTEVTEAGNAGEISAKNEDVLFGETEMIEVDEERRTDVNDEIGKVDTEVIGVDEEEENNSVKSEDTVMGDLKVDGFVHEVGNCGKIDVETRNVDMKVVGVDDEPDNVGKVDEETRGNVDTTEIVVEEEEEGYCFDVGAVMDNTCKEEEIANVDSKMVHLDEEQGNCAKMDGRKKDASMEELTNVDSRVVGVDEEQGNCGSIDRNTSHLDTVEFVVEEEEEEGNGVEIDVDTHKDEEMANLDLKAVQLDVELRNCAKILQELSNVDTEEIDLRVVGEDDEQGNCGTIDRDTSNRDTVEIVVKGEEDANCVDIDVDTRRDEEIAKLDSKAVRVDEELSNCAKISEESNNVDTEEIAVEKEKKNCGDVGIEMSNSTSREEKIANIDSKAVSVDQEQGNCAKFNQEASNAVDMEEMVAEEEEKNCVETNGTSKTLENGTFEIDKDRIEKSNEDQSREETRKRKLPPSMFDQWGKRIKNTEWCSKDANLNVNETKKPLSKETAIRCILDAQKFLMGGKSFGSGSKVDFLETAKRRGMTFPKPRFRSH